MAKRINKAVSAVSYIIILVLIVGAIGIVGSLTNWFQEDFKDFYVATDSGILPKTSSNVTLAKKTTNRFDVRYIFPETNAETAEPRHDFIVRIYPKDGKDFYYSVNGIDTYSFSAKVNLVSAFGLVVYDDYFTLTYDGGMQGILSRIYPSATVIVSDELNYWDEDFFTLQILSYNEKSVISMDFRIEASVGKITLDKGGIQF